MSVVGLKGLDIAEKARILLDKDFFKRRKTTNERIWLKIVCKGWKWLDMAGNS